MSKTDGGPAFPSPFHTGNGIATIGGKRAPEPTGMTLHDYFAAKAMEAAIIGACSWGPMEILRDLHTEKVAEFASKQADAMLAEREKP